MRTQYTSPSLEVLGQVASQTRASFTNNQQDSIFFAGVVVGNAQGSMDACVSQNPQSPSGECLFP